MYRKLFFAIATMVAAAVMTANAATPRLQFRADSACKVLQLTDLHLQQAFPGEAEKVFARMDHLVSKENPDVIIVTGDMLFGRPARPMTKRLVDKLDSYGIPWAVAYGNHDAELDLSRPAMSAVYAAGKNTLNTLNEAGELADLEIPVFQGDDAAFYLYVMDSHDYSKLKGVPGYAWFTMEQVQWMRNSCLARTAPDGTVAPALAFFHIPLPEYVDAWQPQNFAQPGYGNREMCAGIRGEAISCPRVNSGMYWAMRETGSVIGTFVGHDHDSDFTAVYYGIALSFGRYSGGNTVYNNLPRGGKIILMKAGERGFETWTRDDEDRITNHVYFDGQKLLRAKSRPRGTLEGTWTEVR